MDGDTSATELQPGKICTQSGVYRVIHLAHRAPHTVVIRKGDLFPRCNGCGEDVRFRLVTPTSETSPLFEAARKRGAGQGS
ncbi:MAG TPA: hypothetical protein VKU42_03910 [Candidatus Angelobacter sp.]|nr:hypothetical protein [Candidatus Angelobacter sp.]